MAKPVNIQKGKQGFQKTGRKPAVVPTATAAAVSAASREKTANINSPDLPSTMVAGLTLVDVRSGGWARRVAMAQATAPTVPVGTPRPEQPAPVSTVRGRIARVAVAATGLAFAIGTLTACGSADSADTANAGSASSGTAPVEMTEVDPDRSSTQSFYVETIDGRTVPCIYHHYARGGGLSCDWNANGPTAPGLASQPAP